MYLHLRLESETLHTDVHINSCPGVITLLIYDVYQIIKSSTSFVCKAMLLCEFIFILLVAAAILTMYATIILSFCHPIRLACMIGCILNAAQCGKLSRADNMYK